MAYRITQLAFPFDSELRLSRRRCKPNKAKRYADLMGIKGPASPSKPAVHTPHLSRSAAIEAFTPFEHAVLSDMFKIRRPRIAQKIDIWTVADGEGDPLLNSNVKDELYPELSLRNAAAQIILKPLENRLPNYYSLRIHEWARKTSIGASGKPVSLMPQHLLTIDWADSGPGFSWPESYYVTYVPGYDRFVVTASQDSPDAYGCEDFVIGWFKSRRDLKVSSGRVLTGFWRHAYKTWGQSKWEECLDDGLLSSRDGKRLAYRVWGNQEAF